MGQDTTLHEHLKANLSEALLVRLEPGLHHSRVNGIFHNIAFLPGVVDVVDLAAVTRETVDGLLRQPDPAEKVVKRRRRAKVPA